MQTTAQTDVFVRSGLVSEEQLTQAIEKQRQLKTQEPVGDLLVSMGLITERDRVRCLGEQWGVPYLDLTEM
jgi:type IV pilus assembly protein PilB